MPEADFLIKRGDASSTISATLENSGGTAVDIQNANVRWKMQPLAGGTVTIDAAANNLQSGAGGTSNPTTGDVSYSWSAIGTVGRYIGEWEVTYAGGAVQTFPNDRYILIDVLEDVR